MAQSALSVSYKSIDPSRLPEFTTEGAALSIDLRQRGLLEPIGERLRIRRQGGYCGLDVYLVLLHFFSSGLGEGVRGFWDKVRGYSRQLAALAGRKSLASPASLSRALEAAEFEHIRPAASLLLEEACGIDQLLLHPAVQTLDAIGEAWHIFDHDPTATTLRHRALPVSDELPEAKRRSEDTGAPGHAGRKRGDLQFRRITVQHAGSSAWTHAHLSPGNGDGVDDLALALDSVVATLNRLKHPLCRALVRLDGEYGHVPYFTTCREKGLPFISRLNRAKLYEDPVVLERLRTATWYYVPDSLSGPRRSVAELGMITISPGDQTRRRDGGRYEPITIRVVASRFPREGKANHGKVLDGWQVELFAVDLPTTAWPAPEAVAAYFGRASEENRFAQEDRELGLDRIVSYHLPGQELATLCGLSLWNLRLVKGFALHEPPALRAVQPARKAAVDTRASESWPRDPVLISCLSELEWPALLSNRPGFSWDEKLHELRCEEGRPMTLTSVRPPDPSSERTGIILRRPIGGCQACDSRENCLRAVREEAARHIEVLVPTPVATRLRERLGLIRGKLPGKVAQLTPTREQPGPLSIGETLFLPARARQKFTACFLGGSMQVEVKLPEAGEEENPLMARDVADRQRRRKTWEENVARYALPEGSRVKLLVAGQPALRSMLGEQSEMNGGGRKDPARSR